MRSGMYRGFPCHVLQRSLKRSEWNYRRCFFKILPSALVLSTSTWTTMEFHHILGANFLRVNCLTQVNAQFSLLQFWIEWNGIEGEMWPRRSCHHCINWFSQEFHWTYLYSKTHRHINPRCLKWLHLKFVINQPVHTQPWSQNPFVCRKHVVSDGNDL